MHKSFSIQNGCIKNYKLNFLQSSILFYRIFYSNLEMEMDYKFSNAYFMLKNKGNILASEYLGNMGISKKRFRMNFSMYKLLLSKFLENKIGGIIIPTKLKKITLNIKGHKKFAFRSVKKIRKFLKRNLVQKIKKSKKSLRFFSIKKKKVLKRKEKLCRMNRKKYRLTVLLLAKQEKFKVSFVNKAAMQLGLRLDNPSVLNKNSLFYFFHDMKNAKFSKTSPIFIKKYKKWARLKNSAKHILKKNLNERLYLNKIIFSSSETFGGVKNRPRRSWNYI